MDCQQNNITAPLGLCDKADDGEKNNIKSDVVPPSNPPEIYHNRVDIEGELQGLVQLTPAHLKFLEMLADAIRSAVMLKKQNMAPREMSIMKNS